MAKAKTIAVSARLSLKLHAEVSKHAGKNQRSIAGTLVLALEDYMKKEKEKDAA